MLKRSTSDLKKVIHVSSLDSNTGGLNHLPTMDSLKFRQNIATNKPDENDAAGRRSLLALKPPIDKRLRMHKSKSVSQINPTRLFMRQPRRKSQDEQFYELLSDVLDKQSKQVSERQSWLENFSQNVLHHK